MSQATAPTTFCAAFQATAAAYPERVALRTADGSESITWREYGTQVRALAGGLAALGVGPGDPVALMLTNRPEFHLVDTAVLHARGIPFSVYNTLAAGQVAELFANAGNRVVVCEEQFLDTVRAAAATTAVEHVVCVDADDEEAITLADLESRSTPGFDFDASWRAVEPADVLTLIYTSGTTGPPKGVELTHASMLAEVRATSEVVAVGPDDSVISYLPDAHVANRWGAHYISLTTGMQIVTLAELKQMVKVLPSVRPTLFGAVPQIWYRLKAGIEAQLAAEKSPVKRKLAAWAIDVGRQRARLRSDGTPVPRALEAQHLIADRVVLSAVRSRLGLDRVRFAATGAAAIDPDALEFVLGLGLPVCEVWGMSETSCCVTVNPPDAIRIGTVGVAVAGSQLRLADDGELLVRGPLLMKGYRSEPERTADAIDTDGWLHTGDIASIDGDGYVTIVDRKKELMINSAGKNMSPANIEGAVKAHSPLVASVVVTGDDRPYVVALLTLDPDAVAAFGAQHGISAATTQALASHPQVHAAIDVGIAEANAHLSRVEQIRRYTILSDVWEPGGEEITPTLKLKRKPIAAKYAGEIDAMYTTS